MDAGSGLTLVLHRREVERLTQCAEAALPREACGLLGGTTQRGRLYLHVYPAGNAALASGEFLISSTQVERIEERIGRDGFDLVGCYHSHPRGRARPSATDRDRAGRRDFLWLVYSPIQRAISAFWWNGERFARRPLRICG